MSSNAVRILDNHVFRATDTSHTRRHRARNAQRLLSAVPQPRPTSGGSAVRLHPVDLGPWDD